MIIGGIVVILIGFIFIYLRFYLMGGKKAIGTIKKEENGIDYKNKKGKSIAIEVENDGKVLSLIPIEDFTVSEELSHLPKKKQLPYLEEDNKIKVAFANKENPKICTIVKRKDSIYIGLVLIFIGAAGIISQLVKMGVI